MAGTANDCHQADCTLGQESAHAVTRNTQGEVIDKHVEGGNAYFSVVGTLEIFTKARIEGISTPETSTQGWQISRNNINRRDSKYQGTINICVVMTEKISFSCIYFISAQYSLRFFIYKK
jgi:hypothetical protein